MKKLRTMLAVLMVAPACISNADAVDDAYTNTQPAYPPNTIQAVPNLGIAPARNEAAESSAWWDIGLGTTAAVIGVVGLANAKSAEKARKTADERMVAAVDDANYYANWAGWWEGWGDAMEIDWGPFDPLTTTARTYQAMNEADYNDAIDSANEQKEIAKDKGREAGLWTGVGYIGLATGAVLVIKGMLTLSKVSTKDGRISGTNIRIATQTYPDTRMALAYDF